MAPHCSWRGSGWMLGKRFSLEGQLFRLWNLSLEFFKTWFDSTTACCWQWSCGGGRAGDFQGSLAESTSSPHSSEQRAPVLSHPTHAGERGRPLLHVPFLTEARLERGRQPEACGQPAQDWADGFVLHSSLVTCHMQPLPVFAPRARLLVLLPWLQVAVPNCCRWWWWWRSS